MRDIYKWLFGPRGRAVLTDPPDPLLELPLELAHFRAAIAATVEPITAIETREAVPNTALSSRLGGRPWWPKALPYPTAKDTGAPLFLLAQINFAETPALGDFPEDGLLQFFIAADSPLGCDYENPAASPGFHCAYHADPHQPALTDLRFLDRGPDNSPLGTPLVARAMMFQRALMPVDPTDYRFEQFLPEIADDEELLETYCSWHLAPAMRMGGYPTFTQTDPRSFGRPGRARIGDVSLLTIDSTDGIMWGDAGAAQIMMTSEALHARDFARVAYTWDGC